ncbi:hypothetical protein B0T16DRAFT_462657 [Cercophora newfieldiana]|uniref:AAA+ ATPase domain-containing protein n=1 Tax=Cercophora newfieldiana TaxID=92897 RepID=A0AA39XSP2_9PEZI|nr:hypothetical protein B0T16DRAFT_462657 [Cercophora newfieldiana]
MSPPMALEIDPEDDLPNPPRISEKDANPGFPHLDALVSLLRTIESCTPQTEVDATTPEPPSYCDTLPAGFRLRPSVRNCDWKRFKNELETETPCVIDILVANSDLPLQVLDDEAQRGGGYDASQLGEAQDRHKHSVGNLCEEPWIHRVRIRSTAVLQLLGSVGGVSWDVTKTHCFTRPFQFLILHQDRIRAHLETLESEAAANTSSEEDDQSQGLLAVGQILQEIRCYVNFVDESLIPLCRQYEGASSCLTKVRFDDLWYLFRPGELVYLDPNSTLVDRVRGKAALSEKTKQRVGRVVSTSPPLPRVAGEGLFRSEWRRGPNPEANAIGDGRDDDGDFEINLYFLDFDGEGFVPWYISFPIAPYPGSIRVDCLRLHPIRFAGAAESTLERHIAQGEKFMECVNTKHLVFSGTPLIYEPTGGEVLSFKGEPLVGASRYDGEVYVDVKEALRCRPFWSTWNHRYTSRDPILEEMVENYPVQKRSYEEGSSKSRPYREVLCCGQDALGRTHINAQRECDRYLSEENGVQFELFPLQKEDLALLPRRIYVYLLRARFFVAADIYDMHPVVPETHALEEICIDDDLKDTLKAVVREHFQRAKLLGQARTSICDENSHGNDQGLVILLQGPPGTGKTATAEAIAQTYQRPLMVLDMGDIVNVGDGGRDFLRLAEVWNCVVLLDEVDAFLLHRSKQDVHSNTDISLLLRILETFSGLLILTTCRPAVLDQGVKSRVHLNLCLKPLNLEQTLQIFRNNIAHLREIERRSTTPEHRALGIQEDEILKFASRQFRTNTFDYGRWNGRQIRNAFRAAVAIARYQYLGTTLEPQLGPEHFRKVAELTKQYDIARSRVLGHGDSYVARQREERCDDEELDSSELPSPRRRRPRPGRGMRFTTYTEDERLQVSEKALVLDEELKDEEDGAGPSRAEMLRRSERGSTGGPRWPVDQGGEMVAKSPPGEWRPRYEFDGKGGEDESGRARDHFRRG